jgi:hypothetical protein
VHPNLTIPLEASTSPEKGHLVNNHLASAISAPQLFSLLP